MAEISGNGTAPRQGAPVESARALSGALVLEDGTVLRGRGLGATGVAVGEVCFVTAMSGYQETLTDPSFAGQIITFTFPHIGIVGANEEDMEATRPFARGTVMRMDPTDPSNFRALERIDGWLKRWGVVGLAGIDTRKLTRRVRLGGAPTGAIVHGEPGALDLDDALSQAKHWPGLEGMDLAKDVTCAAPYDWSQTPWALGEGFGAQTAPRKKIVAIDYGAKHNILRHLTGRGAAVEVVPADMPAEDRGWGRFEDPGAEAAMIGVKRSVS